MDGNACIDVRCARSICPVDADNKNETESLESPELDAFISSERSNKQLLDFECRRDGGGDGMGDKIGDDKAVE